MSQIKHALKVITDVFPS